MLRKSASRIGREPVPSSSKSGAESPTRSFAISRPRIVIRLMVTGAFGLPLGVPSCSIRCTTSKPLVTCPSRA